MKRAAPLSTGSAILCAPVLTRDGMLFFAHLPKDVCMGLFLEIVAMITVDFYCIEKLEH